MPRLKSTLPPALAAALAAGLLAVLNVQSAIAQDTELVVPPGDIRAKVDDAEATIRLTASECEALLGRYLAIQNDIFEMNTALDFAAQFALVKQSVDEAKEALATTGADAAGTAKKISDAYEKLRLNNEELNQAVRKLSGGLERAGKSMTDTSKVLGDVSEVLGVLEIAVRARDASAADTLRAFAEYFNAVSGKLEPLLDTIPVVGVFISLYGDAILAIAEDVEDIEREVAERNRKMRDLFGPDRGKLYLSPPTESELKQQRLAEKEAELESVAAQILEGCEGRVERTAEGLAPVSVDPLTIEMGRARARVRADLAEMGARVERAFARSAKPLAELDDAQGNFDRLLNHASRRTPEEIAALRAELSRLQPAFRDSVRRQIRAAEIHAEDMDKALVALKERHGAYHRLRQEALQLEREYIAAQKEAMFNLARLMGWDEWWVKFHNPDLFDQGVRTR